MISPRDYIVIAKELADGETGAHKRRAVSTAYYAAFHAFTYSLVSSLVPTDNASLFARVYRKPEHKQFGDATLLRGSEQADSIRTAMKNLRDWREKADYDIQTFDAPPEQIAQLIENAEQVIGMIEKLDEETRLHLAVNVLIIKPRDQYSSGPRPAALNLAAQK